MLDSSLPRRLERDAEALREPFEDLRQPLARRGRTTIRRVGICRYRPRWYLVGIWQLAVRREPVHSPPRCGCEREGRGLPSDGMALLRRRLHRASSVASSVASSAGRRRRGRGRVRRGGVRSGGRPLELRPDGAVGGELSVWVGAAHLVRARARARVRVRVGVRPKGGELSGMGSGRLAISSRRSVAARDG